METLKFYIRKFQPVNENFENVKYEGPNPFSLSVVLGNVPDNNYTDVTDDVVIDNPITFSFRLRNQDSSKGASGIELGSTSDITFSGKAAQFIKDWLLDSVSAHLNAIEIKVVDTRIGTEYPDWIVYNSGMKHCIDDTDSCLVTVNLRQRNEVYECIQKTSITDNHQGWFQSDTTKHLLFDYCNDFRPAFVLSFILFTFAIQYYTIFIILTPIIAVISVLVGAVNLLLRILGRPTINNPLSFSNLNDLFQKMIRLMSGCGRKFVGVLYRDYVSNVCSKCGVTVNASTFPILFDPSSPYYNKVMISHPVKGGVPEINPNPVRWIPDNDPLMFLDQLLDEMKETFNAKWFVKNNTLYFDRKDKVSQQVVFNFENEDKKYIIEDACFTWNEQNSPAYARLEYGQDSSDKPSQDAYARYNTLVEFNKPVNPSFKGELRRVLYNYSPVRFKLDGIDKDYLEKALEPLQAIASATLILYPIYNQIRMSVIGLTGCIIVQNDTQSLKKMVIWDGTSSTNNARTKYTYGYGPGELPPPNPDYNPTGITYQQDHPEDIQYDNFEKKSTRLYNYDLFFEEKFINNLFDRFHAIDDPRKKGSFYKKWEIILQNCEGVMNKLGLSGNSSDILLENEVLLNGGKYYKEGIIEEVTIEYYSNNPSGDQIVLKGRI